MYVQFSAVSVFVLRVSSEKMYADKLPSVGCISGNVVDACTWDCMPIGGILSRYTQMFSNQLSYVHFNESRQHLL
jgi:hypothetical protein